MPWKSQMIASVYDMSASAIIGGGKTAFQFTGRVIL